MYKEEDFLQLSGIQHFEFCRRQWALAYIELQWQENVRTVEGKILHENAHDASMKEKRGDLLTVRAMPIHSREMGVSGECDVVEFHKVKDGIHLGDVSNAIEEYAKKHKLGVVKELVGHGIGSHLHEDPEVPNYGKTGTGIILKKGMTIAVEPMLNLGTAKIYLLDDDWTIVTGDNKPSAHFEHTIIVTDDGYEILTGDDKCE